MASNNLTSQTIELLEAYGNRMYFNLILNSVINGLAVFLIINYSTKAMGWYKYYILMTILTAFFMDFHSCIIYGFYIFLPTSISCPTGFVKRLGWFWGSHFNYIMIHFNAGFYGFSLFYSFIYQYITLTRSPEIFKNPKIIFLMFLSMILYPLPSAILYMINVDDEAGKEYVSKNLPHLVPIYSSWSCSMLPFNPLLYAYLFTAILQISFWYISAVIFTLKIRWKLAETQNLISLHTVHARKQYLLALVIQVVIPAIFMVFPISLLMIAVAIGMTSLKDAQWIFQFCGLHSCGNSMAVMFIIKPYRQALIQHFHKFKRIFFKSSSSIKPMSFAVISTTDQL